MRSTDQKKTGIYLGFFFTLGILLMAFLLDWEYDEAWSYLAVSRNNFASLIAYSEFSSANNHVFNSLYFRLLQDMQCTNPFYYRLISVIGFVFFYYGSLRICRLLGIPAILLPVIVVAPYFFYFSLGRGYSLALGCFCMSLMQLLAFNQDRSLRNECLFFVFGAISCLSVFSFLFCFLALLSIYFFLLRKELFRWQTLLVGLLTLFLLAYIYYAGKKINGSDPNIIGSENLVRNGTVSSIVSDFSYYNELNQWAYYPVFKRMVIAALLLPFFYTGIAYVKKNSRSFPFVKAQMIILAGILLSFFYMFLAHVFTHAKYPMVRSVCYIYFLILLLLANGISNFKYRGFLIMGAVILFLGSLIQIGAYCYALRLPDIDQVLRLTKNDPLYVVDHNPNIGLTNYLNKIGKKNIWQQKNAHNINERMLRDTSERIYLLCNPAYLDSFTVKAVERSGTRFGKDLYRVEK